MDVNTLNFKAMNERQLLAKKEKINAKILEIAELKGERNSLLRQLKERYNCNDLKSADSKIRKMQKEVDKLAEKIKEDVEMLDNKLNQLEHEKTN